MTEYVLGIRVGVAYRDLFDTTNLDWLPTIKLENRGKMSENTANQSRRGGRKPSKERGTDSSVVMSVAEANTHTELTS